ncbi:MAG: transcriptional repressor LexA [Planctomycetia bacterium]|nr:transcriptional repressor LexA [Planctomycetia bacterium]
MSMMKVRNVENVSKLPLTARQREALEFIRRCVRKRGYGPTVREIGDQMGIHSPNGVVGHLVALERKGFIQREANLSRSIMLVERGEKNLAGVQVLAEVALGKIIENQKTDERLDIAEKIHLTGEDYFLLRIKDDSLREEHAICAGDYLLIRRARNAAENETAVLRDYEDNLRFARCIFDPATSKTQLATLGNESRIIENACSGIYGVVVAMMRFSI